MVGIELKCSVRKQLLAASIKKLFLKTQMSNLKSYEFGRYAKTQKLNLGINAL